MQSYPAILGQLTGRTVINAGIPGEISEAGLARLPILLTEYKPDLVVLCHGGNDILRRLDKTKCADHLEQMVGLIKGRGADVIIVGVPTFKLGFSVPDLYQKLAEKHQLANDMTFLAELESEPSLKSDHIHPNATGYRLFGERIFKLLQAAKVIELIYPGRHQIIVLSHIRIHHSPNKPLSSAIRYISHSLLRSVQ
jgi:acyl-CoA thioesterase I